MIECRSLNSVADLTELPFDVFISAAGCERRSTEISRSGFRRPALEILYLHRELAFPDAIKAAKVATERAALVVEGGSLLNSDQQERYLSILRERPKSSILVDISSMTRAMICEQVLLLAEASPAGCQIVFAYLPAAYYPPVKEYPKIRSIAAATPFFLGVDFSPGDPLALVIGVGFEYGVALGVLNQLEPRRTFAFWGRGANPAFDEEVRRANFGFSFVPYDVSLIYYKLIDPKSTFSQPDSVISSLIPGYRLVIVPMGPKLFCLLSAGLAMVHFGKMAVYLVEHLYKTRDIIADGRVILLEAGPGFFGRQGIAAEFVPGV